MSEKVIELKDAKVSGDAHQMVPVKPSYSMVPRDLGEARGIAKLLAASGLFGAKSEAEAFSLMLLADAEGLHPAAAARDYHIIQGRPSLRADAMLARFQSAGGSVEWLDRSDERVEAKFSHPSGGSVTVDWTMDRAQKSELSTGKNHKTWKKYPRQMLTARVISEGVRTVFPGVVAGLYTEEEVRDFDQPRSKPIDTSFEPVAREQNPPAPETTANEVIEELGKIITEDALDSYLLTVTDAICSFSKDDQKRVRDSIKQRRESLGEAEEAAEVLDAEIVAIDDQDVEQDGPFSGDDLPPPGTSHARAENLKKEAKAEADELTDEEFINTFMSLVDKAPSVKNLETLWKRAEKRLQAINQEDPELYEKAAEHWQTKFESLRGELA